MNPTKQFTMDEIKAQAAKPISQVQAEAQPAIQKPVSSFRIDVPNQIPSTALSGDYTRQGVMQKRSAYQTQLENLATERAKAEANQLRYQKDYEKALKQSPDEIAVTNELNRINQTERAGLIGLEGQGKGIPMDILAKQGSKISKNSALQRLAASENLQALTGVRQSKIDSLKAAIGFEDNRLEKILGLETTFRGLETKEKEQARQDISDILEFSQGLSFEDLDPESQDAITRATANTPFTLGQIQQALNRNKVAFLDSQESGKFSVTQDAYGNPIIFNAKTGELQQNSGMGSGMTGQGGNGSLYDVPVKLRPAVEKVQSSFDNESVVKRYTQIAEGYGMAQGVSDKSTNPTEHQALIYAFAKAMDPDSVVREGEYATVQKYSSSWLSTFGFNAQRVIDGGTAILTPDAIKRVKGVIGQKYEVQNKAYQSLLQEKGRLINNITGRTDGTSFLQDYSLPYQNAGKEIKELNGVKYEKVQGGWKKVSFSSAGNASVSIPQSSRLAYVNNNPGNLRYAGQQGATQGEGGFAKFSSPQAGYEALKRQIQLDSGRGLTVESFVSKYAPPTENNTKQYIQQIVAMTGANPKTPINKINIDTLAKAIAKKESSTNIA